jgi:hypothetical protein
LSSTTCPLRSCSPPRQLRRYAARLVSLPITLKIKFMIAAAIVEAVALTPLAISGMGHAGPNGGLIAWASLLVNLPGFAVVVWLIGRFDLDLSWANVVAIIFVTQTAIIWLFGAFVWYLKRRFREPFNSTNAA